MNCPNCGHKNQENDKFCSSCGTRLRDDMDIPRQYAPEPESAPTAAQSPTSPSSAQDSIPKRPSDPEWRMSSLPPEEPPKRRVWLWVLVGILLFCVLLVCGLGVFLTTGTGQNLLDDLATRAATVTTSGTP
ncbi:MAG: zinc-ribbon domain-containing protein [Chloroflexia bacterium]|nr:zinc-ribbon domain-containing protein [Chloroflexia bacterium]